MMAFDALTWLGHWPFAFLAERNAPALAKHLRDHGIRRALVSPLDAAFAPEPGPANRALFRAVRDVAMLEAVPVINPALPDWRDQLHECLDRASVRLVRVLPSYHRVVLTGPAMRGLIAECRERGVKVAIQVRLIDERHEHHAVSVRPVKVPALARFLDAFPKEPVLLSGVLRTEAATLAAGRPHVMFDLAFVEWLETVRTALAAVPARQLVFASHTPFLETAAASAKFAHARISPAARRALLGANLERFLSS
jgi:predicted TIM-barrel fold metal-dependent hydrolase